MPEAKRLYSTGEVNRAGQTLIDPNASAVDRHKALEVFESWRASHSHPMNWFRASLTDLAGSFSNIVQRPKRLESVQAKLLRKSAQKLGSMNDIAGVRAIVPSISGFDRFVAKCKDAWVNHELKRSDDYIAEPRFDTGYRSLHLVYRFKGTDPYFDGRLVEVQIRTRLQHAWATAVEIVDLFLGQSLKSGNGDPKWQRFFTLMSSALARNESMPAVPNTPSGSALEDELRHYAELLRVEELMDGWGSATRFIESSFRGVSGYSGYSGRSGYFVIELDQKFRPAITGFNENDIDRAYLYVSTMEQVNSNVVLVAAQDLERLREAYPNWLIDTQHFLLMLRMVLGKDISF